MSFHLRLYEMWGPHSTGFHQTNKFSKPSSADFLYQILSKSGNKYGKYGCVFLYVIIWSIPSNAQILIKLIITQQNFLAIS
jgi:hypothetical protein